MSLIRMCLQCREPAIARGLCETHLKRPKYTPLGPPRTGKAKHRKKQPYDETWRRISRAFLAENPVCAACKSEGRMTPAQIVDHILPRKYFPELAYERTNLQSLCQQRPHSCHQRKTALEQRGIALDFANKKQVTFIDRMRKKT